MAGVLSCVKKEEKLAQDVDNQRLLRQSPLVQSDLGRFEPPLCVLYKGKSHRDPCFLRPQHRKYSIHTATRQLIGIAHL